jgi:molecular chaperone DnaJ
MVQMSAKRDYYEVLGVARQASPKEVAEAYRKLAIKFHPDKNPGDEEAIAKFKEAAEAFEILHDGEKRARYDRYGHAGVDSGGGGHQFTDINEIFESFGDVFGDGLFGDLFGGGRRGGRRRARKGADVGCEVRLDLLEAAKGVTREVEFDRHEKCSECDGSGARPGSRPQTCSYCGGRGQVVQSTGIFRVQANCPACHGAGHVIKDPCPKCRGAGMVARRVKRDVIIPAGVDHQMRIRLIGEGEPSPDGGPAGDCYCIINVAEHALFHRDGQDLIVRLPISYSQAALGATVEVPTLDGRGPLEVPRGTQSGDVFRLRGKGMPDPRRRGKGDLLVEVHIDVPKSLNAKQEELLRQLAVEEHTNVSPHRKKFFEKLKEYFVPAEEAAPKEE